MRKYFFILTAIAMAASCTSVKAPTPREALLERLVSYSEAGQVAYGHQDDLCYGHAWKVENWENDALERSDVKDATGKYPMLLGFDLGGIELGDASNLDGVPFGLIRKATLKHIERGGIVTYSWHPRNPFTGGDAWDISSDKVVESILPGGEKEQEFALWLQRLGDFLESLGADTPVIFRPWHENVGSWFWWGGRLCSAEQYKALYRMTYDYVTGTRGLTNVLWCYSPNSNCSVAEFMERYPGDDCIDIIGADAYESVRDGDIAAAKLRYQTEVRNMFEPLSAIAAEHGKVLCLSETGMEGIPDLEWWTGTLHPLLGEYPFAYVLTWRNAHDKPGHFYAAWKGFEGADDMKEFAQKDNILFLD